MERYIDNLRNGMLAAALNEMKPEVEKLSYDLQKRYDDLVMLCKQCFAYEDEEMLERLKGMVFELVDDVEEGRAISKHRRYEYVLRKNSHISEELLLIALTRKYDCTKIDADLDAELVVLFRQIWLSGKSTASVVEALRHFLIGADPFVVTLVTYALMLRCVRYYDHSFVELLMEIRTAEAYVALAAILMTRSERIACDKRERELFAKFCGRASVSVKLSIALESLVETYETQRIAEEFEEKIYPEVARKRQDLNIDQMLNEGKKPDWEGMLEGTPLISKMRKINDMQLSGKDVNYATFKAMKGYPFFSETAHWFYPFTTGYWQLGSVKGMDGKSIETLSKAANLCDSDRYSMLLMFKAMGINDMGGMLGNMGIGDIKDLKEMVGEKWQEGEGKEFLLKLRYAVMNLYRFYNLAPNHSDFETPFESSRRCLIQKVVPASTVYSMAKTAYRIKDYVVAIALFERCENEVIDEDVSIYEKMGFCYYAVGETGKAIEYYDKANVLDPDNLDVLRGLSVCYSDRGNYLMSIKTCKRIEEREPDDLENLYELAVSLQKCELYDEAMARLYKCDYQKPEYKYWILMARILHKMGRFEEAAKYFDKACEDDDAYSWNLVESALNDLMMDGKRAEQLLRECYKIENNVVEFMAIFEEKCKGMIDALDESRRKRFTNLINKIIIDL